MWSNFSPSLGSWWSNRDMNYSKVMGVLFILCVCECVRVAMERDYSRAANQTNGGRQKALWNCGMSVCCLHGDSVFALACQAASCFVHRWPISIQGLLVFYSEGSDLSDSIYEGQHTCLSGPWLRQTCCNLKQMPWQLVLSVGRARPESGLKWMSVQPYFITGL